MPARMSVPGAAPPAIRGHGHCLRPPGAGRATSARRPPLHRSRESKGTDVIREAHQLLKNCSLNFIGNVEGRDVLGNGRRDRVRRLHGQRGVEDQRGARRHGGTASRRRAAEHFQHAVGTCCRCGRSAAFASAWTTRSMAALRCSASMDCASSGTAGRRRRPSATPSRWHIALRRSAVIEQLERGIAGLSVPHR